jgi:hypothetical protein
VIWTTGVLFAAVIWVARSLEPLSRLLPLYDFFPTSTRLLDTEALGDALA